LISLDVFDNTTGNRENNVLIVRNTTRLLIMHLLVDACAVADGVGHIRNRIESIALPSDVALDVDGESTSAGVDFGSRALGIEKGTRVAPGSDAGKTSVLGDRLVSRAIVLPSLLSKAKEEKEDEGTKDDEPSVGFEWGTVGSPNDVGDLDDTAKVGVGVCPSQPGVHSLLDVGDDGVDGKREVDNDFPETEGHEAEVAVLGAVAVASHDLFKLRASPPECTNGQDSIDSRDESDEEGNHIYQDKGDGGIIDSGPASKVFKNVEAMTLRNISENQVDNWDAQSNSQVDHDTSSLFSSGDGDRLDGCDMVQAAIDT